MAMRIVFQIFLVMLPFILFGFYRLATRNTQRDSERWPFLVLLLIGFSMSAAFLVIFFLSEPRGKRTCETPPRFENGEIIPGETIPCENAGIDSRESD